MQSPARAVGSRLDNRVLSPAADFGGILLQDKAKHKCPKLSLRHSQGEDSSHRKAEELGAPGLCM